MSTVRLVTVAYGAGPALAAWASAAERARAHAIEAGLEVEVVLWDNLGDASSMSATSWLEVRSSGENLGFAGGCNAALTDVGAETLIVLANPDVVLPESFLVDAARLEAWSAHPRAAVIGPLVRGADGEVEQSARSHPRLLTGAFGRTSLLTRLLPDNRLSRAQLLADPGVRERVVDWVSGACMLIPASRWREVGPLDEGYFMYWEDADWCRRAADLGLETLWTSVLAVTHHQGASSRAVPLRTIARFHRSALRYHRLHAPLGLLTSPAVAMLLGVRATVKVLTSIVRGGG